MPASALVVRPLAVVAAARDGCIFARRATLVLGDPLLPVLPVLPVIMLPMLPVMTVMTVMTVMHGWTNAGPLPCLQLSPLLCLPLRLGSTTMVRWANMVGCWAALHLA